MRKVKWKPLTCKILRGTTSIDQDHHDITFPLCDPRLRELSILAEENKAMAKKLAQGITMALKCHGAILAVDQ